MINLFQNIESNLFLYYQEIQHYHNDIRTMELAEDFISDYTQTEAPHSNQFIENLRKLRINMQLTIRISNIISTLRSSKTSSFAKLSAEMITYIYSFLVSDFFTSFHPYFKIPNHFARNTLTSTSSSSSSSQTSEPYFKHPSLPINFVQFDTLTKNNLFLCIMISCLIHNRKNHQTFDAVCDKLFNGKQDSLSIWEELDKYNGKPSTLSEKLIALSMEFKNVVDDYNKHHRFENLNTDDIDVAESKHSDEDATAITMLNIANMLNIEIIVYVKSEKLLIKPNATIPSLEIEGKDEKPDIIVPAYAVTLVAIKKHYYHFALNAALLSQNMLCFVTNTSRPEGSLSLPYPTQSTTLKSRILEIMNNDDNQDDDLNIEDELWRREYRRLRVENGYDIDEDDQDDDAEVMQQIAIVDRNVLEAEANAIDLPLMPTDAPLAMDNGTNLHNTTLIASPLTSATTSTLQNSQQGNSDINPVSSFQESQHVNPPIVSLRSLSSIILFPNSPRQVNTDSNAPVGVPANTNLISLVSPLAPSQNNEANTATELTNTSLTPLQSPPAPPQGGI